MAKSTKQLIKDMKDAKKSLQLKLDINQTTYHFDAEAFDLDHVNLPLLSEQISKIPGHVGYIVEAVGEAEKYLSQVENDFEVWQAKMISKHYSDLKSEKAKLQELISDHTKDYEEYVEKIREAKKIASVMKAYSKGIEAKLQLAQTLSANIRTERDANTRNYDKQSGDLGD